MKKFKNKATGVVYETNNEISISQFEKHVEFYEAIKAKEQKVEDKLVKEEK